MPELIGCTTDGIEDQSIVARESMSRTAPSSTAAPCAQSSQVVRSSGE
jgi:hypothetical protein